MDNWYNWVGNFVIELVIAILFTGIGYMIHGLRRRMDMNRFQAAFGRDFAGTDGAAGVLLHLQRNQPETVRAIRYFNARPSGKTVSDSDRAAGAISTMRSERP